MSNLYAVNAGYRKSDIGKNWYYVIADSVKEARQRFSSKIVWLDVYQVIACEDARRDDVLCNRDKYIVF